MSEYLSEEEQLEQLRSFWKTWGLWILAGVVLAVGGYFGWTAWQSHARDEAMAAAALYQAWLDAGDDKTKAESALKALTDEAEGSSYHAFVLLKQASEAIEDGKLETAEPLLRQVAEKNEEPLLRSLASIRLASVLQGLDKGDEALKLLDRVSGAGFRTAALEMKGDIHMARDERREAHAAYKAALDSIEAGQKDSLLEAKVANAAPVPGAEAPKGAKADKAANAGEAAESDAKNPGRDDGKDDDEAAEDRTEAAVGKTEENTDEPAGAESTPSADDQAGATDE